MGETQVQWYVSSTKTPDLHWLFSPDYDMENLRGESNFGFEDDDLTDEMKGSTASIEDRND